MHLRRALLLFAIVLGLAALATAVSQPATQRRSEPTTPKAAAPAPPAAKTPEARFSTEGEPRTRQVEARKPVVVVVETEKEPGQVAIERLGLTATAEPLTPARIDVLPRQPGRYEVLFAPAGEASPRPVGRLVVE